MTLSDFFENTLKLLKFSLETREIFFLTFCIESHAISKCNVSNEKCPKKKKFCELDEFRDFWELGSLSENV